MCSSLMLWRKAGRPEVFGGSWVWGEARKHPGTEDLSQPAVGIVTTEPQGRISLARPPTAQQPPRGWAGVRWSCMFRGRLCPKVTGTRCPHEETQRSSPRSCPTTGPPQLQALKAKAPAPKRMPSRRRPRPRDWNWACWTRRSRSPSSAMRSWSQPGPAGNRAVGDVHVSPQCVTCTSLAGLFTFRLVWHPALSLTSLAHQCVWGRPSRTWPHDYHSACAYTCWGWGGGWEVPLEYRVSGMFHLPTCMGEACGGIFTVHALTHQGT